MGVGVVLEQHKVEVVLVDDGDEDAANTARRVRSEIHASFLRLPAMSCNPNPLPKLCPANCNPT
jgi:hypothetical protein